MTSEIVIVIPNYNGAQLLQRCLESIERQNFSSYSIVVVDNGSSDESHQILGLGWVNLTSIFLPKNVGFGAAVNIGISSSEEPLILVLNNDTELYPDCLQTLRDVAQRESEYAFFAPKIVVDDDRDELYAAGLMFSDRGYGNRSQRFDLGDSNSPRQVIGACGAATLFRRKILDKVGLFNEDYFFLNEDLELSLRHQLLGHKCLYVPNVVISHIGSSTLMRFESLAVEETVKNSLCTLITLTPGFIIRKHFFRIISFYLHLWRAMVISGYSRETVRGLLRVIYRIPRLLLVRYRFFQRSRLDEGSFESLLYTGTIYVNLPTGTVQFD